MPAGSSDFQRALGMMLTAYIAQISFQNRFWRWVGLSWGWLQSSPGRQLPADFQQMCRAEYIDVADQRGFAGIVVRDQQCSLGVPTRQSCREYSAHTAQFPTQGEFAEEFVLVETFAIDLSRGCQNA